MSLSHSRDGGVELFHIVEYLKYKLRQLDSSNRVTQRCRREGVNTIQNSRNTTYFEITGTHTHIF